VPLDPTGVIRHEQASFIEAIWVAREVLGGD
jgi:hypothetical protein